MLNKKINRRNAISSALTLGLGLGILSNGNAEELVAKSKERRPRRLRQQESKVWKYVPIDPAPAAQKAYEYCKEYGCMFGFVKAAILAYANAIETVDPEQAEICRRFPVNAFKYGKEGYGGQKSLCGAVNGAGFFMGLFIESPADLCLLQKKLTDFYKETQLPTFIPETDNYPNFVKTISGSILCKDSSGVWLAQDDAPEHKQLRPERCKRLVSSVLIYAIQLLNEHFASEDNENVPG